MQGNAQGIDFDVATTFGGRVEKNKIAGWLLHKSLGVHFEASKEWYGASVSYSTIRLTTDKTGMEDGIWEMEEGCRVAIDGLFIPLRADIVSLSSNFGVSYVHVNNLENTFSFKGNIYGVESQIPLHSLQKRYGFCINIGVRADFRIYGRMSVRLYCEFRTSNIGADQAVNYVPSGLSAGAGLKFNINN